MRHNRRRAIANIPLPELQDAYLDVVDYSESLQRRCAELADNVRVLRQKYASAKAENADLIWNRLVRPDMVLSGLPAVDDGVAESDGFLGPYAHGGRDLYGHVGDAYADFVCPEPAARHVVSQLVAACTALAASGVVHHDIKSENVLVTAQDGRVADVRLTDLGMSDRYGGRPRHRVAARVQAHGRPPEFAEALALALADLGDALRESTLPAEAKGFLERALTEDPADRPTIEDLAGHPWVARHPHLRRLSRAGSHGDLAAAAAAIQAEAKAAIRPTPTPRPPRRRGDRADADADAAAAPAAPAPARGVAPPAPRPSRRP
ncbi:protein kinase [Aureococcus anophagefferens]|nr:protein kinase [Aureococcus anophagefferens]